MKLLQTIFTSLSLFALLSCGTSAESDDSQALALLALASAPQTVNLNFEALANGQNLTLVPTLQRMQGQYSFVISDYLYRKSKW